MTKFFVKHPVTTWMAFAAFIVLGLYSLPRLKLEAIPEVDLPRLSVTTTWNGASPQVIQRSITLPIEEAVRQVHGVENLISRSSSDRSVVEAEFRRDIDIDFARLELSEQIGAVRRDLPEGAGQPQIQAFVPEEFETEEFFSFNIESPLSTNELRDRAEIWILPKILALEGIADARIQGGARPLIKILLDRQRLDLYEIQSEEIFGTISTLDELSGAGVVRASGAEALVSLRDPMDVRKLERAIVARRAGRNYRLDELAEIQQAFEDPQYFIRANGKNVVQIMVEKRSGANTVSASRALRNALPEIQAELPFEVNFHINSDQGEDLEDKLVELVWRSGAILALLFILLALSLKEVRLTAIVIASIFFAIVISLSLFYFFRISVNFITISGLTVCFGMILDNSILVLDSIHRRVEHLKDQEAEGLTHASKLRIAMQTVIAGTKEVTFPIIATTITTVVAFVSFIFLSGRLSLYYVPLAISVATAMIASLFVAFGWLPVVLNQNWAKSLANRTADGDREIGEDDEAIERFVEPVPDLDARPRGLERLFHFTQRFWWIFTPPVLALVIWSFATVYETKIIKGGFWQIPDPTELILYMQMPSGTDVEVTSNTMALFEGVLEPIPEGCRVYAQAFGSVVFMRITFEDELLETHYPLYYRESLVDQANKTGGTSIFIRGFSQQPYFKGNFGGAALNSLVKITGYNSKILNQIAEGTLERAAKSRRVRNARITSSERFRRNDQEEAVIAIDRDKLAEHNLNLGFVIGNVRRMLGVDTPWRMLIEGDQEQVQMIYEDSESIQYSDLVDRVLVSPTGEKVRVGDLIHVGIEQSAGDITRDNQRYSVHVNWEYVGTDKMRTKYIKDIIDGIELPYGYTAEEARQEFFTQEEEEDLKLMVLLASLFIFMVLAALFESLSLPLLVMGSLPLALVGVFLLFWWSSSSFDSSARIGLVLLFGIVVNNAILLVSRFRHESEVILRQKLGGNPAASLSLIPGLFKQLGGSDLKRLDKEDRLPMLRRAIAHGTRVRMRSILLTSGTTMIGLAPLLIDWEALKKLEWQMFVNPDWEQLRSLAGEIFLDDSGGRDIWVNLALTSFGGLAASTILIVLMVPIFYYLSVRIGWDRRAMIGIKIGFFTGLLAAAIDWIGPRTGHLVAWTTSRYPDFVDTVTQWNESLFFANAIVPALFLGLVAGILWYRARADRGSYADGLVLGATLTATAALVFQTYSSTYPKWIDEELLERIQEHGQSLLDSAAAWAPISPLVVTTFLVIAGAGLVMTMVLALLAMKRGPELPSDPEASAGA